MGQVVKEKRQTAAVPNLEGKPELSKDQVGAKEGRKGNKVVESGQKEKPKGNICAEKSELTGFDQ